MSFLDSEVKSGHTGLALFIKEILQIVVMSTLLWGISFILSTEVEHVTSHEHTTVEAD